MSNIDWMIRIKHKPDQSIRINKQTDLFYVAYVLYLVLLFINQTELAVTIPDGGQLVLRAVRYICYVLFLIKIITTNYYKIKFFFVGAILSILVFFCAISASQMNVLILALICFASYGCDYKKIIKLTTIVFAAGLLIVLVLCFFGVMHNQILSQNRNRYNLGFNWVTLPQLYVLFITIGYINIRRELLTIKELVLIEIINIWIYIQTDTRLASILTTCLLLFAFVEKYCFKNRWHIFKKINLKLCMLPVLICLVVFFMQSMYTPSSGTWAVINDLLSGRLKLTYNNLNTLPITIFGQEVEWHGFSLVEGVLTGSGGNLYNNVDCSYFRILLNYGVTGLLIALFIYTKGIQRAVINEDYFLVLSYLVILLFSITEQWMLELSFNPFVVVAVASLSQHSITLNNKMEYDKTRYPHDNTYEHRLDEKLIGARCK